MRKYSQNLKNSIADRQEEEGGSQGKGEIMEVRNGYRMEQWREIIQECQKSGLSNKAYCQQQGISEKTYYYWLRKLHTAAVEQAAPQIMEVKTERGEQPEEVYIRYRGAELRLPGETEIEAIAAILRSLQQL